MYGPRADEVGKGPTNKTGNAKCLKAEKTHTQSSADPCPLLEMLNFIRFSFAAVIHLDEMGFRGWTDHALLSRIIKHERGTLADSAVTEVVEGEACASLLAETYNEKLTPQERAEGWSYFASRISKLKPGADPALATKMWWIECHGRRRRGRVCCSRWSSPMGEGLLSELVTSGFVELNRHEEPPGR